MGSDEKLFLKIIVSAAAATAVEKRVPIVRVIKVNLSFGELKIVQMVQNFNRLQLLSYIFIVWKKNWKKLKEKATETKKRKTTKNSERYKLSAQNHHPPLQKFDFKANFLKKVSPDAPKSFARGVGVLKSNKNQFLESSNTLY